VGKVPVSLPFLYKIFLPPFSSVAPVSPCFCILSRPLLSLMVFTVRSGFPPIVDGFLGYLNSRYNPRCRHNVPLFPLDLSKHPPPPFQKLYLIFVGPLAVFPQSHRPVRVASGPTTSPPPPCSLGLCRSSSHCLFSASIFQLQIVLGFAGCFPPYAPSPLPTPPTKIVLLRFLNARSDFFLGPLRLSLELRSEG